MVLPDRGTGIHATRRQRKAEAANHEEYRRAASKGTAPTASDNTFTDKSLKLVCVLAEARGATSQF